MGTGFRTWEQDSDHASIVSCFKLVGRPGLDGLRREGGLDDIDEVDRG